MIEITIGKLRFVVAEMLPYEASPRDYRAIATLAVKALRMVLLGQVLTPGEVHHIVRTQVRRAWYYQTRQKRRHRAAGKIRRENECAMWAQAVARAEPQTRTREDRNYGCSLDGAEPPWMETWIKPTPPSQLRLFASSAWRRS